MTALHVNAPYSMLFDRLDDLVKSRLNPEIYFSADDLDSCRVQEAKTLAEALERNRLEVSFHGPFMDLSPGGMDRKIKAVTVDRFSKTIELARSFKPKMIVFHPGYEKWTFDGNEGLWLESSLETWEPLVKKASELGLTFAIENVYEEGPDTLKALLGRFDSLHFRFCFDTGHHHVFGKSPLPVWMESLGRYLGEVHLHDNHGQMDEHLPVGEGTFPFGSFFNLLSQLKLSPIYTIEPHTEEHLKRTLKAVRKYIDF